MLRGMDDYDQRLQQIIERVLAAKSSFWSGLLTAHTVLLSVAVTLLVANFTAEKYAFKFVGYVAIFCVALLLLNFAIVKAQYEIIGQRLAMPATELTQSQQIRDIKNAEFRQFISIAIEMVTILGLGTEVVLLGWVLAIS